MRKQAIWISIVVILLGVGVGLLVALPKNALFTAQETTPLPGLILPNNQEDDVDLAFENATAATSLLIPQFVAEVVIDKFAQTRQTSTSFWSNFLVGKAQAQKDWSCTSDGRDLMFDIDMKLSDEFNKQLDSEIARLNLDQNIIDHCYSLYLQLKATITLYQKVNKDKNGTIVGIDYQASVVIEYTMKSNYFNKDCVYTPGKQKKIQVTKYYSKPNKGKIKEIGGISPGFEKTNCVHKINPPIEDIRPMPDGCPKCKKPSSNPVDGGSFGGTIGGGN